MNNSLKNISRYTKNNNNNLFFFIEMIHNKHQSEMKLCVINKKKRYFGFYLTKQIDSTHYLIIFTFKMNVQYVLVSRE